MECKKLYLLLFKITVYNISIFDLKIGFVLIYIISETQLEHLNANAINLKF